MLSEGALPAEGAEGICILVAGAGAVAGRTSETIPPPSCVFAWPPRRLLLSRGVVTVRRPVPPPSLFGVLVAPRPTVGIIGVLAVRGVLLLLVPCAATAVAAE